MKNGKLLRLVKKTIPYIVIAFVLYFVYNKYVKEGFQSTCTGGQVPQCSGTGAILATDNNCYTCGTNTTFIDSTKKCSGPGRRTTDPPILSNPVKSTPICACPAGKTPNFLCSPGYTLITTTGKGGTTTCTKSGSPSISPSIQCV